MAGMKTTILMLGRTPQTLMVVRGRGEWRPLKKLLSLLDLVSHHLFQTLDLDNFVEFKSISRAGFKFSPDKLLPRCEIIKMRPKLLAERHKEQNLLKKLKDKEERDVSCINHYLPLLGPWSEGQLQRPGSERGQKDHPIAGSAYEKYQCEEPWQAEGARGVCSRIHHHGLRIQQAVAADDSVTPGHAGPQLQW